MKQYCRYCVHCYYGDVIYCDVKEVTMSDSKAKHTNNCKSFDFCEIDALMENDKPYTERTMKQKNKTDDGQQISIFENMEMLK